MLCSFVFGILGEVILIFELCAWEIVVGLSVGNKFVVVGVVGFTIGTASNLVKETKLDCVLIVRHFMDT